MGFGNPGGIMFYLFTIFLVVLFTGCGGFLPWTRSQTVTLLYTNNTNGLLEACG